MTTGEEKKFSVGVVLSVVTGLLLCGYRVMPDLDFGIQALLVHMTGVPIFPHQLQRARRTCGIVLARMFPALDQLIDADTVAAEADRIRDSDSNHAAGEYCAKVVAEAQARFGQDELSIPAGCAEEEFWGKDPVEELCEMRGGKDDSIVVVTR